MKRQFFYIGLGIAVIIAVYLAVTDFRSDVETARVPAATPSPAASSPAKAEIGGPFSLIDHNGKAVTDADYRGRYMLIFFGYTFCPDVCPTALTGVSGMLDILGDDAAKIAPLFISVDPERDTVAVLKEYVGNFHPQIIGLTGSPKQIASVASVYRAYFAKEDDGDSNGENYSVSHSAYLYLMGPDGKFLDAFGHQMDPEDMAARIRKFF